MHSIPPARLLVVDDDPDAISLLSNILNQDYDIIFALTGDEAIELAIDVRPDVILLDIMMPNMDGYQICKILKSHALTKDIPIVFLTSRDDVEDEIRGLEMGASGYIRKPFHPKIIKIYIKNQVELKYAREKLTKLAITDGLTGIANRRYFDDQLVHEWSRARRLNRPLALAMVDVDWFKRYNDHYGHQSGDECLRRVADVLTQIARRDSDFVARYGGEEFVIILPMTQSMDALNLVQRMCTSLSDLQLPHALSDFGHVTISIGVTACLPSLKQAPESLVEKADRALYAAKEQGRNRATLFV